MKIAFFIGSMKRGGAERVISMLANYYSNRGWNVDIIVLLENSVDYHLNCNINIIDFSIEGGTYKKNIFSWGKRIRKYIKRNSPDRIVSFIGRINALVLTSTIGFNTPIIVSERNDPRKDGRSKIILKYCNLIYKRAYAIVYQTEYEKSCFSNKLRNQYIIPNPIRIATVEHKIEKKEIVTAGRLMPQKNQKLLIDSFKNIRSKYPNIRLKIYGEGILRQQLQRQIDDLGLHESVELLGNISDLHEKIAGALMFVLTSEYEGLSNALLEAMMLGIPCISTNYSGAEEIITNKVNGLIVQKGDVDGLSKAMESLLEDKELLKKIKVEQKKTIEKYQYENVIKQWKNVIEYGTL